MWLLAAAVLGAGAVSEASACGVPMSLPGESGSAFIESRDYRFRLTDVWGTVKLSSKETMEFGALFSPIENLYRSRYLGVHWSLPVFEATFLRTGSETYQMTFPTGHSEVLEKTKIANQPKANRGD